MVSRGALRADLDDKFKAACVAQTWAVGSDLDYASLGAGLKGRYMRLGNAFCIAVRNTSSDRYYAVAALDVFPHARLRSALVEEFTLKPTNVLLPGQSRASRLVVTSLTKLSAPAGLVDGAWKIQLSPVADGAISKAALVGRVVDMSCPFGVGFERAGRAVRVYTTAGGSWNCN